MEIETHATHTVPAHEVRLRAQQALLAEVTYDALKRRLEHLEVENRALRTELAARK